VVVHVRPCPDRASAPLIYSFLRCAFVCLPLPEFTALAKRKMDECQMHHSLQSAFTRVRPGRTTVGTPLMKTLQELVRAWPYLTTVRSNKFLRSAERTRRDDDSRRLRRHSSTEKTLESSLSNRAPIPRLENPTSPLCKKKKEAAETHVGDYGRKLYRIRVFYKFVGLRLSFEICRWYIFQNG
jgi:hypothetical protein